MARLGRLIKQLNIGLTTAVEFLNTKGETIDSNPNQKLSAGQETLLVKEFSSDQSMKEESERLSQKRHEKEKPQSVAIEGYEKKKKEVEPKVQKKKVEPKAAPKVEPKAAPKVEKKEPVKEVPKEVVIETKVEEKKDSTPESSPKSTFKVIDTIDLDALNRPKKKVDKAPQKENKKEVKIVTPQKPKEAAPTPKPVKESSVKDHSNKDTALHTEEENKKSQTISKENVDKNKDATSKDSQEIFTLHKPSIGNKIKVVAKIDLSAINDSTRPAKKSREERKKERLAKQKKKPGTNTANVRRKPGETASTTTTGTANANNPERKKRRRIGGERIDVKSEANKSANPSQNSNQNQNRNHSHSNNNHPGTRPAQQGRKKKRRPIHAAPVTEEDVAKQVKETLARLTEGKRSKKKGARYRKDKREANAQRQSDIANKEAQEAKVLKLTEFVTANELAVMMSVPVTQIIQTCFNIGIVVSINQRLDAETINIVAEELGFRTEFVSADIASAITEEEDKEEDLMPRPPIVTVMGHVDHGKTSLLDYVRQANVIAGEAGGITQHIGAYNVAMEDGRKITFLDTPGHEAFTAMRARGAKVTDIAVIIVAADDDVMPQTKEAINHASAAGVPIVFAINKIDKPNANPEKVKESLAQMNYLVEEWGGKYQSQDISAKSGLNVDALLEKVLLEAEMLELKANPNRKATGSIIESTLDKGRGYVSTVLVENGTLHQGDIVLAGTAYGRIKAMFNERNQRIKEAGPAEPAIVLGLNGAPQAGDTFNIFENDHEAREIANKREQLAREQGLRTSTHLTLEEIGRRIALGSFQELNVIVKGDVDGSIEALSDSLLKLSTPEIQVNVIHKAVGQISESDVMLAAASDAIIIGFQVRPSAEARRAAEKEEVDIRLYSVIYDAIEELKSAMEGMLSPEIKEEITASLEIREVFKITKVGTIAGCMVKEGKIKRNNKVRLIRDGIVVYTGELASLKRMKDDVKEVGNGFECGLNIQNYNDIKVGDIVESYEEVEVKKTLK